MVVPQAVAQPTVVVLWAVAQAQAMVIPRAVAQTAMVRETVAVRPGPPAAWAAARPNVRSDL